MMPTALVYQAAMVSRYDAVVNSKEERA